MSVFCFIWYCTALLSPCKGALSVVVVVDDDDYQQPVVADTYTQYTTHFHACARNVAASMSRSTEYQLKSTLTLSALQIQDRSPKSRPVASLNQSQTQLTRPVATGLGLQRDPS